MAVVMWQMKDVLGVVLQVVVHNLPWSCTWQNLKDAFAANTQNIERADVIIDGSGRSRWAQDQILAFASLQPCCSNLALLAGQFYAVYCKARHRY